MATYSASNAECFVFSFKDGLLSKLAHDLKIKVARFSLEVDENAKTVQGTFDTQSLEVACARVDGRDDEGSLSRGDKKKIHGNITKDVLKSKRHPEATFTSTSVEPDGEGYKISGDLMLHGRTRPITAQVRADGDDWVTEISLDQQDFGIKPFSAALGALKVKPRVQVMLRCPR